MKSPFDAVLFDLDGTLADTAPDLISALNALLVEEHREPMAEDLLRPHVSRGSLGLIPIGFGVSQIDEAFDGLRRRFIDRYENAICVETRLFNGIYDMLAELDRRGTPWGIVTNKSRPLTIKLLPSLGLDSLDCLVCGDDLPRAKPWPDTLLLAADRLNLSPDRCLYVGDFHRDIEAATAAGMASVAVTYGYGEPDRPISTWGANFTIDSPAELLSIVYP